MNIENSVEENNATYSDNLDILFNNYIDEIYGIISKESSKISNKDIIKIVDEFLKKQKKKNDKIVDVVMSVMEHYLYFYIMIYVSHRVKDFTQFVISFNKDSIFNSIVTQGKSLLEKIIYLSSNEENIRKGNIVINSSYNEAIQIYNELGDLFTSNVKSDETKHAVLKYILYTVFFVQKHKNDLYAAIEILEFENAEFNMIEIVDSVGESLNYLAIEKLFSDEKDPAFVEDMFKLISGNDEDYSSDSMTIHDKISLMFKKNILIPITDDFLRFNKNTESYDKGTEITQNTFIKNNKKSNTKIKYILAKMNEVLDYNKTKKSEIFYSHLKHKKAILINNNEELDIVKKLGNVHNKSDEQMHQLEDLLALRKYPYQSFRDFANDGFSICTKGTVNAIRYTNIEFYDSITNKNEFLDWRIINEEISGDVIGIAISGKTEFNSVLNKLSDMQIKNNSMISSILSRIKKQVLLSNESDKMYYWIFNKTKDFDKRFIEIDSMPVNEFYMFVLEYLFTEISNMTFEKIINVLNSNITNNVYDLYNVAQTEHKKGLPINAEKRNELQNYIYRKSTLNVPDRDEKEDFIPGLNTKLEPLSKPVISRKIYNTSYNSDEEEDENDVYHNSQCQHNISWKIIKDLRKSQPNKFNDKLHGFIKEFVIENVEKDLICKSCSQIIELKKYVSDWTSSTEEGITLTLSLQTTLENMVEYEKYNVSIKNISKIIEKISSTIDLHHLVGAHLNNEFKRQNIIKMIIDLINLQNEKMKILSSEKSRRARFEESVVKYGIILSESQFFLFELKNEIFTFSSQESDKFKRSKINNIVAYTIIMLLLEITNTSLKNIPNDNYINYHTFEKIGFHLFDNLKIHVNMNGDILPITKYKTLCYALFVLSGMVVKNKIWFVDTSKTSTGNANVQRSIIQTCIDLLNDLLQSSLNASKYAYEFFTKKFFIILRKEHNEKTSEETVKVLKENIDKKMISNNNGKMIFKIALEKEFILMPYFEKNDFGELRKTNITPYKMSAFRKSLTVYDIYGKPEMEKFFKERKYTEPKPKMKKIKNNVGSVIDKLEFGDYYSAIESYINKWEGIIGEDTKINSENLYLRHKVFKIDHDYRGNKIDSVTLFTSQDKILTFKKNDSHFLINVYYYHNKENNVYMYYNSLTFEYLGYRSGNTYININGSNCNLEPRYSISHMLMYLGHSNVNYMLTEELQEILKTDINIEHYKLHKFLSEIIKQRILNMKNMLLLTQQILNQLLTDKKVKTERVSIKFIKKLKNVVLRDENGKPFNDINEVIGNTFFKPIPNDIKITFDKDFLHVSNIIKINNSDQDLVLYFCKEFDRFIDMNTNQYNKINIVYLMCSIIEDIYTRSTYREVSLSYSDVKRFVKMESNLSSKFTKDDYDVFHNNETINTDDDDLTSEEDILDDQETQDAIDIDIDPDDDEDDVGEQLADTFRD